MHRVHVLEFEDQPWFPPFLRRHLTNVIVQLNRMVGLPELLGEKVGDVLDELGIDTVVDLGSGSGGVMPEVLDAVRRQPAHEGAKLVMTDLYPNRDVIAEYGTDGLTRYESDPVDATDLAHAPAGLKTMVNSFHHLRPPQARAVLESAYATRQPLLVYELAENKLPFVFWLVGLPFGLTVVSLMSLFLTLRIRPLTASQLFFTYVIPLVPFFYAWDGQASFPRIYNYDDLDALLQGLDGDGYTWEKGPMTSRSGKTFGMFLLGRPT